MKNEASLLKKLDSDNKKWLRVTVGILFPVYTYLTSGQDEFIADF